MDQQSSNNSAGGQLTCSTLSLMVPTLRLMSAFAWQVVQHCNMMHYGKVEELVQLVTEVVPHLLSHREKFHILLGLRARELFPEIDLQTLVWEFISRLDKLLPLPDIKQTTELLSAAPSLLEECGQLKFESAQLETLLHHHALQGNAKESPSTRAEAEPDPAALMTQPETTSHSQAAPTTADKEKCVDLYTPPGLHACSQCSFSHSQEDNLLQHIRQEHTAREPSTAADSAHKHDDLLHMRIHSLPFHCDHCDKRYERKAQLIRHRRLHTAERPFMCTYCGRRFRCSSRMQEHVRTHTNEWCYKCHICGKTFIQHQGYKRHMLMHKGEKNYLCTECGKAFLTPGELRLHTRSHTGEKPYLCTLCGKRLSNSSALTVHMRTHTREKPYSCTHCSKAFTSSSKLKRHMFIHFDKKPFECFKCGKGFTQKCNLKTHIRTCKSTTTNDNDGS